MKIWHGKKRVAKEINNIAITITKAASKRTQKVWTQEEALL
jgi:hypothetical protein